MTNKVAASPVGMPWSARLAVMLFPILAAGCDEGGLAGLDGAEPLPAAFGRVEVDLAFGDPPFEGEVQIIPAAPSSGWTYEVDLDSDGAADETGSVGLGVHVGFRYDEPGPYRIRVILYDGTRRYARDQIIVVNDSVAV